MPSTIMDRAIPHSACGALHMQKMSHKYAHFTCRLLQLPGRIRWDETARPLQQLYCDQRYAVLCRQLDPRAETRQKDFRVEQKSDEDIQKKITNHKHTKTPEHIWVSNIHKHAQHAYRFDERLALVIIASKWFALRNMECTNTLTISGCNPANSDKKKVKWTIQTLLSS